MTMKIDLSQLTTEQQNPDTANIDTASSEEIVAMINREDKKVAEAVEQQLPVIAQLIDIGSTCIKRGGRILYIGAGTSGRLGVLDAAECPPTYGVSPELVQGIMAGGYDAMFKAKEGAEDSTTLAREDLQNIGLTENDLVIGLAASGRTPYVVGGLDYARQVGAPTGSICCVENGVISRHSDYPVEVITGPEAITGSTRMKAGTAQKLVLNMISTGVMVKCGKVYHNLMVDVQPTNEKLVERAKRIIAQALECDEKKASCLFEKSGHDVKTAIAMGATGLDKNTAGNVLTENEGNVSVTIHQLMEGR